MIIGLCGVTFFSVNYGVSALAYSQISLINKCAKELNLTPIYYVFSIDKGERVKIACKKINVENVQVFESARFRTGISGLMKLKRRIAECDIVFDLTKGDSFSDIYGYGRFILQAFEKYFTIKYSKLVISPQTIGPFNHKLCAKVASYFISNSYGIYARDDRSAECVNVLDESVNTIVTSDLAFYLPYSPKGKMNANGKTHIGINVSGLLWQGGYTGKNEFGLRCNYQRYTTSLIEELVKCNKYCVHLIAHVYMESGDGDYQVCELLKEKYPVTILAPQFETPMEAKSYFSSLDVLIGARMHATIGAISSGIVCIPVSYSRKFEGLYGSLNYPYVIQATKWTTEECLKKTVDYIEKSKIILPEAERAVTVAKQKNRIYENNVTDYLRNLSGG